MKREKVRVWWQKLDADGNVLESGVDEKEYISWGCAINRAEKLFGKPRYRFSSVGNETTDGVEPRIRWRISHRDPWVGYYEEKTCDICGTVHMRKHTDYGYDQGDFFWMSKSKDDAENKYRGRSVICPDCTDSIIKHIEKLEKGRKK